MLQMQRVNAPYLKRALALNLVKGLRVSVVKIKLKKPSKCFNYLGIATYACVSLIISKAL